MAVSTKNEISGKARESSTVGQPPRAERLRASSVIIFFLGLILGMTLVSGYIIFKAPKLLVSDLANSPASSSLTTEQNRSGETSQVQLTGYFYVGPSPFRLVYESSDAPMLPDSDIGKYVLLSNTSQKRYILREESANRCGFDNVYTNSAVSKQDTVRVIIEYHCGDAPKRVLLGIAYDYEKKGPDVIPSTEAFTVIPSSILELKDSYYSPQRVLGWLTADELLVRETIREPNSTQEEVKYWKVSINDPEDRQLLNI